MKMMKGERGEGKLAWNNSMWAGTWAPPAGCGVPSGEHKWKRDCWPVSRRDGKGVISRKRVSPDHFSKRSYTLLMFNIGLFGVL